MIKFEILVTLQMEYTAICCICFNNFKTPNELYDHLQQHFTPNYEENRLVIDEETLSNDLFEEMVSSNNSSCEETAIVRCKICTCVYTTEGLLDRHMYLMHSKSPPYQCEECKNVFGSSVSLKNHKDKMHSNQTYNCTMCSQVLSCEWSLHRHKNVQHALNIKKKEKKKIVYYKERKFPCIKCDKEFVTYASLNSHINKMHK